MEKATLLSAIGEDCLLMYGNFTLKPASPSVPHVENQDPMNASHASEYALASDPLTSDDLQIDLPIAHFDAPSRPSRRRQRALHCENIFLLQKLGRYRTCSSWKTSKHSHVNCGIDFVTKSFDYSFPIEVICCLILLWLCRLGSIHKWLFACLIRR